MSQTKNDKNKTTTERVVAEINSANNHSYHSAEPSLNSSTENVSPSIFTKPQPINKSKGD